MNEGLEALKELRKYGNATVNYCSYLNKQCDIVEKELKALKYLVKKLDIRIRKSNSILDRKNTCYLYTKDNVYGISIKNYDLLKEILL